MRGRTLFLLSLVATALLGLLVHRPRLRRIAALREEMLAANPEAEGARAEERVRAAADRLAAAMGFVPVEGGKPWSPLRALEGIPVEGPIRRRGAREVVFRLEWNHLPRLLARLGNGLGPPPEELSALPTPDPERCEVTLRFAPLATGFTPR